METFDCGDVAGYMTFYSRDVVTHGFPPRFSPDFEGLRTSVQHFREMRPDVRVAAEDIIAEDDRVALRIRISGTHSGALFGNRPTGNRVEVQAMTILHFDAAGRIKERWVQVDEMALLTHLGTLPAAAQAAP